MSWRTCVSYLPTASHQLHIIYIYHLGPMHLHAPPNYLFQVIVFIGTAHACMLCSSQFRVQSSRQSLTIVFLFCLRKIVSFFLHLIRYHKDCFVKVTQKIRPLSLTTKRIILLLLTVCSDRYWFSMKKYIFKFCRKYLKRNIYGSQRDYLFQRTKCAVIVLVRIYHGEESIVIL